MCVGYKFQYYQYWNTYQDIISPKLIYKFNDIPKNVGRDDKKLLKNTQKCRGSGIAKMVLQKKNVAGLILP